MRKTEKYKDYISCPVSNMATFKVMISKLETKELRELKELLSRGGGNKIKVYHINTEIRYREPRISDKRPWPISLDIEWEKVCRPFRQLKRQRQVNEK